MSNICIKRFPFTDNIDDDFDVCINGDALLSLHIIFVIDATTTIAAAVVIATVEAPS